MPVIRLQKALAEAGIASRRHAEAMIAAGRVTVDGEVATTGLKVDPSTQAIAVDGRPVSAPAGATCIALHKPLGVTSTVSDPHAVTTVLDLVPSEMLASAGRLYPVGRLDRDSEGLLLLTNDGEWAQRVLHPRHQVEREYAVGLARPLAAGQGEALLGGVELEEGRTALLDLRPQTPTETGALLQLLGPQAPAGLAWYRATLGQGWKRQVRRMFGAVGAPVSRLVRVRIGTLRLGGLRPGQVRQLTRTEAALLVETGPPRSGRG